MSQLLNGSGYLNGKDQEELDAHPRRADDDPSADYTDWRRERPKVVVPSSPSNPWGQPQTLISLVMAVVTLVGAYATLGNQLATLSAEVKAQGKLIDAQGAQLTALGSVDAALATLTGQVNAMTSRLDAQRQTLTAIEAALMERAGRGLPQHP